MITHIQLVTTLKKLKIFYRKILNSYERGFIENHMVLKPEKCHYLIINKDIATVSTELVDKILHAKAEEKLLLIIMDKGFTFQNHTKSIIKTDNQTLTALIRLAPVMPDFDKNVVLNSFIKGDFTCCPLLLKFSTRAVKHKINSLHERGLRALLNNEISSDCN